MPIPTTSNNTVDHIVHHIMHHIVNHSLDNAGALAAGDRNTGEKHVG
jgi:hypothetical protein